MTIRFDDRVAIITGAGRGLGRCYAMMLAVRGASVVVNDLGGEGDGTGRSAAPAQEVVDEITASGAEAIANYDDVATIEGANKLVQEAVDRFGKVDILINNAGILRDKSFLKMDLADFEKVLQVHVMGTVYVTKAVFPIMRERAYGRIVLATSAAGLWGNFGQTNYATAKMGVIGFMNALKQEGRKYDIRANTIAPLAASRLGEGIFPDEIMPVIKPELVGAAVLYLCSEQCAASGDIISAGAGLYAKAEMIESPGVRFDLNEEITPEMIAGSYAEITDMTGARHYDKSDEEVAYVFASLTK
jgi:NAD(P)-dependent dehydrogenase (short-subunit alcohol dehydrogenase family)